MESKKDEKDKFNFLVEEALELGAKEAKVIPASYIVVENRVALKCRSGCINYGRKLMCPPNVPTPDEFRKIAGEYSYALLVKFGVSANVDSGTVMSIYKNWLDPDLDGEKKERAENFWKEYGEESMHILPAMLELEKKAFNNGYTLAIALANDSCRLCRECNIKGGVCRYPSLARIPEHAMGVNMKKTSENAGMPIKFPFVESPDIMALLLID
ncbi:putative metal-binding protein [Methanomicrobium sp. W14]|uniref:DUF2284 domain-containing protein n=1 Tax=Methanomicrobium sp. W14 TaxID=2817839 RepID=UPI0032AF4B2B|nr:putative metal-binding protein [Methanomicrobium sp. W14]